MVVGVDDNPPAQVALRWAVQEARLHDLPLRLVTVDRQPGQGSGSSLGEMLDAAAGYASERLPAGRVEARRVAGQPAEVLLSESLDAGMLVVGSRSLSTIASMALGSVSSAVAAHAACPVVVVRAGKSTALHNVVVGVDGSDSSVQALAFAFEEAALRGLSVCVSHVWRPNRQADPDIWTSERENVEREHRRSWLRQYVAPYAAKYPGVPVTVLVSDGRAATVLAHQSVTADLVVVGSRGHGGLARLLLGSVSQGVLHHAQCSVAVIRDGVLPEPRPPSSGEEMYQR
ncbi:universal stress protein [Flindersiella endophytica]